MQTNGFYIQINDNAAFGQREIHLLEDAWRKRASAAWTITGVTASTGQAIPIPGLPSRPEDFSCDRHSGLKRAAADRTLSAKHSGGSMNERRRIHVFIASPGDLAVERKAFKSQIELLNADFGNHEGIEFVPLGWEDTLASTGRRAQSVINAEIDRCDVFILTLHRRWGQAAPDATPYTSYTEEEFHRALDRFAKTHVPEIFVFFKQVDSASTADPGEQLKQVLGFRRHLEESHSVLYRHFSNRKSFMMEVDRHLRAYSLGTLPKANEILPGILLPMEYLKRVTLAESEAKALVLREVALKRHAEAEAARADGLALEMAREAAEAALKGHVELARQKFAKATSGTVRLSVLSLAIEFSIRTGDLAHAEDLLEQWLALSGEEVGTAESAMAMTNLGVIFRTRGEIDKAEEMFLKALEIHEKVGRSREMAEQYSNLGSLYWTRGSLDRAEEMYHKALAIDEDLGLLEGKARDLGRLGVVCKTRGDLDRAEKLILEALTIDEQLGCQEGMARHYGNLGVVNLGRKDLRTAETMFHKALAIDERIENAEGIAKQNVNLGSLYRIRGEFEKAEEYLIDGLAQNERLGCLTGIAAANASLGNLYLERKELAKADQMHRAAISINERLGSVAGLARSYHSMAILSETCGNSIEAYNYWVRALELYQKLGDTSKIAHIQGQIAESGLNKSVEM